jgi:hypothetical protein
LEKDFAWLRRPHRGPALIVSRTNLLWERGAPAGVAVLAAQMGVQLASAIMEMQR